MKKSFLSMLLPFLLTSWLPAQAQQTLVVATGNYKPFEFIDENGKLTGYDIELGNEIARRLKMKFVWKQMDFMQILPSLDKGSSDLAIAAIHCTKYRQEKYAFSRSYIQTGVVVVVKRSGKKISSLEDLKDLTVAVKEKATGEEFATLKGPQIGFSYKSFLNTEKSFEALNKGEVDAVFNDYLSSRLYLRENPDLLIPLTPFAHCGMGIAASKSRQTLINRINSILVDLEKEGFLKKLYNKWLL